ncbi:GTP-binding protein [Olsenella sp. YH-ols2223]|uniref:GTP-binding protein n=1 Tax=Olsenella absiana TaxID=3115222 RepID=A0ABU7RCA7_9ACTN
MTKVDLVVGFLGAGKTTLVNRMLADGLAGERPVIVENEFGDVAVDGDLIPEGEAQVRTLASGCICCTLRGSFLDCLDEVVGTLAPSRIVIEPTGLANLPDLLTIVRDASSRLPCRLNSVTSVVDASCVAEMLEFAGDFYASQVRDATLVALTHTAGLGAPELEGALRAVRSLTSCPVMDVDAAGGLEVLAASEAALEEAASLGTRGEKDAGEKDGAPRGSRGHDGCAHDAHGHDAHGHLHAPGGFGSFSFLPGRTFSEEDVDLLLEGLRRVRSGRVLRAKGFLARKDRCGLEHVELAAGGAGHECSAYRGDPKLVVIGRGLDGDELARIVGAEPEP